MDARTSPLPHGWQLLATPGGQPLYYCAATRQTTWQPPPASERAVPQPAAHGAQRPLPPPPPPPPPPPQRFPTTANAASNGVATHARRNSETTHPRQERRGSESDQSRYTFPTLVHNTRCRAKGYPLFELEREKVLQINLGSTSDRFVLIKCGTMIARRGKICFSRQRLREEGISTAVKRALTGEGIRMAKCEGRGTIYCAFEGRAVCLVQLREQSVFVNGDRIIALSESVQHGVHAVKSAGVVATGLFAVRVSGSGFVAFLCEKSALTLRASADDPVYTDADATVAWTHQPTLKLDLALPLVVGRRSGQEVQLKFSAGVVIVQPFKTPSALVPERVKTMASRVATGALHALT